MSRRRNLITELRITHEEASAISAKIATTAAENLDAWRLRFLMQEWLSLSERLSVLHAELRSVTNSLEEE